MTNKTYYNIVKLALCSLCVLSVSCVETDGTLYGPSSIYYHEAPDSLVISGDGDRAELGVVSTCEWGLTSDSEWLTVEPASGTGDAAVTVATDGVNPSWLQERRALLTLSTADGIVKRIVVVQRPSTYFEAPRLAVSPTRFVVAARAGIGVRLTIDSNTPWRVRELPLWAIPDIFGGTGQGVVTFSVADNTTLEERSATIVVEATDVEGLRQEVELVQQAATLPVAGRLTVAGVTQEGAQLTLTGVQSMFPITGCGLLYSIGGDPVAKGQRISLDTLPDGDGTLSTSLSGLQRGQAYTVCAFVASVVGTAYTPTVSFTTVRLPQEGDNGKPAY